MSEIGALARRVPVWAWVALLVAMLYQLTIRVGVTASASAAGLAPVQSGGPPAPHEELPGEYTHQCPVSWRGRWSWSPNKVGEWLYAADC